MQHPRSWVDPNLISLLIFIIICDRLSMEFLPSSSSYGFSSHPLEEGGEKIEVTIHNARRYIDLTLNFIFFNGISSQMEAMRGKS